MSEATLARRPALVLADLLPGTAVRDLLLVGGAAVFVGALAQISVHLPGTPVPMTGQTLGVVVAGAALGWRRAGLAMALYLAAGLAGVPWFSGHASGYAGASFGYVLGFIPAAAMCGYLAQRQADRSVLRALPAMVTGGIVIYAFGLAWLAADLHLGASAAIRAGLVPFLAGDAIKTVLAALLLPGAWRLAGHRV